MALSSAHPNPHVLVVQITEYDLKSDDKYLIIATDGVWEFLESRDAATIGWEAMQTSQPGKGRGDSKVPALSADAACTALIVASDKYTYKARARSRSPDRVKEVVHVAPVVPSRRDD